MKIAIDNKSLTTGHSVRGIGVNTKELIDSLEKNKTNDLEIFQLDLSAADISKYDLVHFTSFNPYFISFPLAKRAKKTLLTIHDLIYLIYPHEYPSGIKGYVKFNLQKAFIKNIDRIVTISETSKKDICRFLNVSPEKVDVVYLGAKDVYKASIAANSIKEVVSKYNLPKKFILYVGGVNYNKNLLRLADAAKNIDIPLVIVGKAAKEDNPISHPENIPFINFLKKYKEVKSIYRLGYVSDEDLAAIYKVASVYCQPSLYEGFGLNAVEAMVAGCPVVVSKINVHKEVLGDAALYFNLDKENDLENKLEEMINNSDVRNKYIKKGKIQSQKYSWDKTAKEMIEVYKSILK